MEKSDIELQTIIKKLYEDNALGLISNEQYASLSRNFVEEQAQMKERFKLLEEQLGQSESKRENSLRFLDAVRQYTNVKELTKLNGTDRQSCCVRCRAGERQA